MNSNWNKSIVAGITAGITLSLTLTVLLVVGWKSEKETTETEFTLLSFKRTTDKETQTGSTPHEANFSDSRTNRQTGKPKEEPPAKIESNVTQRYVDGNWVSGKSTMRYVMKDNQGHIDMFGYDVMRGQDVYCGSGSLVGRKLTVPNFYSFLDNTRGTLKLNLSEDGKTLEGYFEGNNPTQEARVVLVHLP